MKPGQSQISHLLHTFLKLDFRATKGFAGQKHAGGKFFIWNLVFYTLMGLATGFWFSNAPIPFHTVVTVMYSTAGFFILSNIFLEYQEIILAPTDGDVLYWRPVDSRTIYLARVLHVITHVGIITLCFFLAPSIIAAAKSDGNHVGVFLAYWVGASLNGLFVTAVTILLYGIVLKRVRPSVLQNLLAYFQLVVMMVVFIGFQMIGPMIQKYAFLRDPEVLVHLNWLPTSWFAALPAMAGEGWNGNLAMLFATGLILFLLMSFYAVRRLAPAYQSGMQSLEARARPKGGQTEGRSRITEIFASLVRMNPLKQNGFHFFLGNMRGDPKLKVGLLPMIAMPLGLVFLVFLQDEAGDPYASFKEIQKWEPAEFTEYRKKIAFERWKIKKEVKELEEAVFKNQNEGKRELLGKKQAELGAVSAEEKKTDEGSWLLFYAVYLLVMFGVFISKSITGSSHWKAAWIYYVAPLRRFDQFYSGVLWGVFYSMVLPGILLVISAFLVLWDNPLHVAAHVILPFAVTAFVFPLVLLFGVEPPFSREPKRNQRAGMFMLSIIVIIPIFGLGFGHFALRGYPLELVAAGLLLLVLGLMVWKIVNRRLGARFMTAKGFEG